MGCCYETKCFHAIDCCFRCVFCDTSVKMLFYVRRCIVKKIKYFHLAIISVIAVLIAVINPLSLNFNQRILFSSMFFTIALWATSAVHKSIACVFLLVMTLIFGNTKFINIVNFTWSDTNLLIITTTLLSVGIMKTGIVHQYVEKLLKKSSSKYIYVASVTLYFRNIFNFPYTSSICQSNNNRNNL